MDVAKRTPAEWQEPCRFPQSPAVRIACVRFSIFPLTTETKIEPALSSERQFFFLACTPINLWFTGPQGAPAVIAGSRARLAELLGPVIITYRLRDPDTGAKAF